VIRRTRTVQHSARSVVGRLADEDPRKIPVLIIVRDRLTSLARLVERLERSGQERIVLVDNASTYPPLLEYLAASKHEVVFTQRNDGPSSPWRSGLVSGISGRFVVTDPDVYPDAGCPDDYIPALVDALDDLRPRSVLKVGMSIRVDDLPLNEVAQSMVVWEVPRFWQRTLGVGRRGETLYDAFVDTTFALYSPGSPHDAGCAKAARIGPPYQLRCDPWYEDPLELSDEERYYCLHANQASNWAKSVRRVAKF